MSLNVVTFGIIFPLVWLWGVCASWVIISYHKSKPTLQQTLVDLLNSDLVFGHALTLTFIIASFYVENAFVVCGWPVPETPFLILAWFVYFWALFTMLYMSYSVIVRYVYVFSQRMILEDYPDEALSRATRRATYLVSTSVCLVMHLLGARPPQYISYCAHKNDGEKDPEYSDSRIILPVAAGMSVLVNVVLRFMLWRAKKHIQAQVGERAIMMKRLTVILVIFLTIMTAINYLPRDGDHRSLALALALALSLVNLFPTAYVACKAPLRKHAASMLWARPTAWITAIVLAKSNSVAPSAATNNDGQEEMEMSAVRDGPSQS